MQTELRSRKTEQQRGTAEETAKSYLNALNEIAPTSAKKYVNDAAPFVIFCARGIEIIIPMLVTTYDYVLQQSTLLEKYQLHLLIPSFLGIVMCFFGGRFMTIIAACEAYRLIGLDSQLKFVRDLKVDFAKFLEANKDDDQVDVNNDGVADVKQIDKTALVQRKFLLFLKTVDPVRVGDALAGLQSGFLAVVATLKMQFCKAITLGSALGEIVLKPANKYVLPVLEGVLPETYKKWAKPTISYTVKCLAVSFAWFIQRIISAFHSAVRGGHMFTQNILEYLNHMGYYQLDANSTQIDEMMGYFISAAGLWYQLRTGFALPFPLNVLLLPFTMLEWWLIWILNLKA